MRLILPDGIPFLISPAAEEFFKCLKANCWALAARMAVEKQESV